CDEDIATHRYHLVFRCNRLHRIAGDRRAREQRQSHREFAASVEPVTGGSDLAPVQLDESAYQREPDTQTPAGVDPLAGNLSEQLEYTRHGVGGNSDSGIAHADFRLPAV